MADGYPRRLALAYPASLAVAGGGMAIAGYVLAQTGLPAWLALALMGAGLVLWTLLEYLLHRFALHGLAPFQNWHAQHHRVPQERIRIPLAFSVPMVLVLLVAPALLLRNVAFGAAVSLGLLAGEMLQEAVHERLHRGAAGLLDGHRKHHDYHHLEDAQRAYGTLTGFWDRRFHTAPPA